MDRHPVSKPYTTLAPRPKLASASDADNYQQKRQVPALVAKQHSEKEWLEMYPHIQKLYVTERRKLQDVMARMERDHNFKATKQMYKIRFTKWGFAKSKSRQSRLVSSALAILPCIPSGGANATSSSDEEPQERHTRRRRLGALVAAHNSTTVTLVASPRLSQDDLSIGIVLKSVRTWNVGNFDAGAWASHPDTMSLYVVHPDRARREDSSTMYRTFALASDLFTRGHGALAGKAVRKAFLMLEDVVYDDGPSTMWNLIDMIYDLLAQGQFVLLDLFLKHFAGLARQKLPGQHPLIQIFSHLRLVNANLTDHSPGDLASLLQRAWNCNADILETHLGCDHLWLYEQLIWDTSALRSGRNLAASADQVLDTLWALEGQARLSRGESDASMSLRIYMLLLEFYQMQLKNLPRSRQLAQELLRRSTGEKQEDVAPSLGRIGAYARKMLARMDIQAAAWNSAEVNMRGTIKLREAVHGKDSPRVVREMWFLEVLLQKAGKTTEGARVGADAIDRVSRYLADIPDFHP